MKQIVFKKWLDNSGINNHYFFIKLYMLLITNFFVTKFWHMDKNVADVNYTKVSLRKNGLKSPYFEGKNDWNG